MKCSTEGCGKPYLCKPCRELPDIVCGACGSKGPPYYINNYHSVQRRFTNWSGTWTNAVACNGKKVVGDPL